MTEASTTGARAVIADIGVMAQRSLTLLVRSPMTVVIGAAMPILLLLLMSVSFGKLVMPGAGYRAYVQYSTPLFVVMGVLFGALSTAIATHADRDSGFDDRLRTLPVAPLAPLAGRIAGDLGRNLLTVVLVTVVAALLGFRFHNGLLGALGYLVLPLVFGIGVAWLMVAVALASASAEAAVSAMNALMLLLSFLSTGFVRADDLPDWVRPIASANPISHVAAGMRAAADPSQPMGSHALVVVAWAVGMTVVGAVLAVRFYRRVR